MKLRLQPHHAPRFHTLQAAGDAHVTTLPVPGFRQARDYTCGFTTALMVLRYFGVEVPALELFRRLGTGRDGTRQNAILRELRATGLRANIRYDVTLSRIAREIDLNKLVIGYLHDAEHWLVIYGYGRNPDRVYVADPRPDEPCEQPWDEYSERLNKFGIICSLSGETSAIRQEALGLSELVETAEGSPLDQPPPPPVRQLRCEVRALATVPNSKPTQLALPF